MRSRGKAARGRCGPRGRSGAAPRPAEADLPDKYAALCAKYRALVEKYEIVATERSGATMLALAAMRASVTALAAVQDGRCVVRNERWLALAGRATRWRGGEEVAGCVVEGTLEQLALQQAERLDRIGASTCAARWEEEDGGRVIELRLERVHHLPPTLVLAMLSDVSDRVRGERELARMRGALEAQERLRAVGELASGVAHDLNNTLHALTLRLARVQACVARCPEHAEDLRGVERIATAAQGRVRRLQELASRRAAALAAPVDLAAVVSAAAEAVRPGLAPAGRQIEVEVRLPGLPLVLGDGPELDHVFLNLLGNARDAMPGGGRIEVTGGVGPDGFVEVAVADEGTGVPPELVDRIFEPFFSTKGRRGSGLGLSMVRSAVTRLGGTVRVENRLRGGARFTVRLPPAPAAPAIAPQTPPPSRGAEALEVLVVDDDPDNLEAMRLVLEGWGQKVEVTKSGREAIGRVERGARPDLVLCDLGLGDATGWEVAQRVRAACPETRVVIVTGWAEEIARDDPRRSEVVAVLPKPVQPVQLLEVLGRPTAQGAHSYGASGAHPS